MATSRWFSAVASSISSSRGLAKPAVLQQAVARILDLRAHRNCDLPR
jgi:hypothetical protein